jgi:hypothetical protein
MREFSGGLLDHLAFVGGLDLANSRLRGGDFVDVPVDLLFPKHLHHKTQGRTSSHLPNASNALARCCTIPIGRARLRWERSF